MALHAAAMMAFFMDSGQQAQCVIKCMPSVPEPEWRWWFGALAPWVGPLLSGVVSIYVAWRVFHWQGERDRKQWIRDQKKAEWSRLLESVANLYRIMPIENKMSREIADSLKNELKPAIRALRVALANCIFLEEFRHNSEKWKKITDFIKSADITSNKVSLRLEQRDITREKEVLSEKDRQEIEEKNDTIVREGFEFADKSNDLLLWLQEEAVKDLMS